MTKLKKNTAINYIPGHPAVPADPGYPPQPSYLKEVQTVNQQAQGKVIRVIGDNGPEYKWIPTGPPKTITKTTYVVVPGNAGKPPTPGEPGTPAQLIEDFQLGWNAGAISQSQFTGNRAFTFKVPFDTLGVVAGLAVSGDQTGYESIVYGLHVGKGRVQVMENGVARTANAQYFTPDTVFRVQRVDDTVTYAVNGTLLYTSSIASDGGNMDAVGNLYSGGDIIDAAAFAATGADDGDGTGDEISDDSPLVPTYGLSAGALAFMTTAGTIRTASYSKGSFAPLESMSADHPYGGSAEAFQPLESAGGPAFPIDPPDFFPGAYLTMGSPKLLAYGEGHEPNGFKGKMKFALAAFGGATAKMTMPRLVPLATGTGMVIGRLNAELPAGLLTASGTAGGVGRFQRTLFERFMLRAYAGGAAKLTTSGRYKLTGSASAGAVGYARLALPGFMLVAGGVQEAVGRAILTMPNLRAVPSGRALLAAPKPFLRASGGVLVALAYEAYAVNLLRPADMARQEQFVNAVTHYPAYPFTQIVRYNGDYFGVGATGLFRLGGDTDAGAPISWEFETCMTDFRSKQFKRVVCMYVGGRVETELVVTMTAGETNPVSYTYTTPRSANAQNYRVKFGKGIKARYYSFKLADPLGRQIDIDSLDIEASTLERAI